jgi:hypothetical protein
VSGSILLGAVAARTETIEIARRACPRRGVLRTDKLVDVPLHSCRGGQAIYRKSVLSSAFGASRVSRYPAS